MQIIGVIGAFIKNTVAKHHPMSNCERHDGQGHPHAHGHPHHHASDAVALSKKALKALKGAGHRCHHVRPNLNRVKGLQKEIDTLYQQLQSYTQSGSWDNVAATQKLIERDQAMQVMDMMGADL